MPEKLFGVYDHKVMNRTVPSPPGLHHIFLAPHIKKTKTKTDNIHACKEITILAESKDAGLFLDIAEDGKKIFVSGPPE